MAKQKTKKQATDSLKEVKQFSKAILKLLKGLKKKNRGTVEYSAQLQKANDLNHFWQIAFDKHTAEHKEVKPAAAKKKTVAKKK